MAGGLNLYPDTILAGLSAQGASSDLAAIVDAINNSLCSGRTLYQLAPALKAIDAIAARNPQDSDVNSALVSLAGSINLIGAKTPVATVSTLAGFLERYDPSGAAAIEKEAARLEGRPYINPYNPRACEADLRGMVGLKQQRVQMLLNQGH